MKPNIRAEPNQREMILQNLKSCKTDDNPDLEVAWCLLRLQPRGVPNVPNGANVTPDQIITFCHVLHHSLPRDRPSYTTVTYSPIIDAKPAAWPPCTQRCETQMDTSATRGQHHAIQTIHQQLYALLSK